MKSVLIIIPGIFSKSARGKYYHSRFKQFEKLNNYEIIYPEFDWNVRSSKYLKLFTKKINSIMKSYPQDVKFTLVASSFSGPLAICLLNKKSRISNIVMHVPTFSFNNKECRDKYLKNMSTNNRYNHVNKRKYEGEIVKIFKKIDKVRIPSKTKLYINIGGRDWLARKEDIPQKLVCNAKIINVVPYSNHAYCLPISEQSDTSIAEIKNKEKILRDNLFEFNEKIIKELEI